MVPGAGFEPTQRDSKPLVLPLDDPGMGYRWMELNHLINVMSVAS
jgi:hypothetical protein